LADSIGDHQPRHVGVEAFRAIITPPQAAILAVGKIADRVMPLEGRPAIRPLMTLSPASDDRCWMPRAVECMRDVAPSLGNPQAWPAF
jgi:pyruvate dehydrogenase E2 component (dihydrolipoyllysine-residue acetyltransferase)